MTVSLYRFVAADGTPRGTIWSMCMPHAAKQKVPTGMKLERVPSMGGPYICFDCSPQVHGTLLTVDKSHKARKRFIDRIMRAA